ncbi:legumin type B, partial [Morus notabilis]|uniref:legumin type B n=1 Tax=Morus notabilis TaxID=981085 RepID=UPI000CED33E8
MAKRSFLSLSLCLLVLFQGSLAISRSRSEEYSRRQNECQFDRLQALEPDSRIQAEAGVIESWNPNHDQFQCACVAVVRRTVEPNGLHLPSYTNTPQLMYIVRGRGIIGTVFPGCAETFEESQKGQGRSSQPEDRHQKLRHVREGDIVAIPVGVAYWSYNNGDQQLVSVTLLDTSNVENQLDQNPRRFYLAGNPEDEFEQQQQQYQEQQGREPSRRRRGSEDKHNIFRGLNTRFIEEAFNVDSETARRIQGQNDNRNNIIKVKGGLDLVSPLRSSQ